MDFRKFLIIAFSIIFGACSTTNLNKRDVASLDEVAPAEKGSCAQVIKSFISGRKVVRVKGLSTLFSSKKSFLPEQTSQVKRLASQAGPLRVSRFSEVDFPKKFQTYAYSKFAADSTNEIDAVEFNLWFKTHIDDLSEEIDSSNTLKETYEELIPKFKAWRKENGFSFKNIAKLKRASAEQKLSMKLARESAMTDYNSLVSKEISSYTNYNEFLEDVTSSISNFHSFESNFQGDDFIRWMTESEVLSVDFFKKLQTDVEKGQKLGDFLATNYTEFLPFSKKPITAKRTIRERIKGVVLDMFTKKKTAMEACGDDADCIARESKGFFRKLIEGDKLKKNFSCLRQFPQAVNALVADFVVTWAMLGHMYKSNEEDFNRFPWEVVANGVIFSPIMAEVNCQSSFQTRNGFGGVVNIAKQPSKVKHFLKSWRRVSGVSLVAGVGLVGMGLGFNQIYASLGHPVENTESLQEQIKLLPFIFMWSGVLGGLKNVAIMNPLKYKVIPKIASMIQTKTGVLATSVAGLTAMNLTLSGGNEYYDSWSFNEIWRYHFLPKYLEIAGYDHPGDEDLNGTTRVEAFDENSDIYITEYESGVKSSVKVEKSFDEDGHEYIKVEDIDIEIPDYIIEESVEDIPKASN